MRARVTQDVLWLNVSVANALRVDVGDRAQQLVRVELHQQVWHHLLHLEVLFHDAVGGIRNVVHNDVEVDLIWLVPIGVKRLAHFDAVRVVEHFQNLELSVFVALVLKDFLDCHSLSSFRDDGFEHNSE